MVLGGALLAAALLLYASGRFSGAMEEAHSTLVHQITDVSIRLQRMRNREANFRSDAEAFQRLEVQGIKGPEQRLAWVHLMERLPRESGLLRSDYQLAAQRPYARIPADEGGVVRLSATQVSVQIDAAHEGRLVDFLDRLERGAPGLLVPRSCSFESASRSGGTVSARCLFDWMTLDP
jgi:hypothetical protein